MIRRWVSSVAQMQDMMRLSKTAVKNKLVYLTAKAVAKSHYTYRIGKCIDFHKLSEGRSSGWVEFLTRIARGHWANLSRCITPRYLRCIVGRHALGDTERAFPWIRMLLIRIDSKALLQRSYQLVYKKGFSLVNIDSTILITGL